MCLYLLILTLVSRYAQYAYTITTNCHEVLYYTCMVQGYIVVHVHYMYIAELIPVFEVDVTVDRL